MRCVPVSSLGSKGRGEGMAVDQYELPDLLARAAQASLNRRYAAGFLHDARGGLQAVFSAFELLSRAATLGADPARVAKACALARRAISSHEKATLEMLQLLTFQCAEAVAEVGALLREAIHFVRNEAATRQITVTLSHIDALSVSTERGSFKTLLTGLLTAALDRSAAGAELLVTATRHGEDAWVSIASPAGYGSMIMPDELGNQPLARMSSEELTMWYAKEFLQRRRGRVELSAAAASPALNLYYPALPPPGAL